MTKMRFSWHLKKFFQINHKHSTDFRPFLDIISQISMTATFFWLTSLGYFIWKTFRSRNVFLRVTDGKKYCWYSFFAWGSTISMGGLATVAHIFVDVTESSGKNLVERPETIGLLGRTIFFIANCIAIGTSIYFYVSTHNYLRNRLNASFGRIHHKLRSKWVILLKQFFIKWGVYQLLTQLFIHLQLYHVFLAVDTIDHVMDILNDLMVWIWRHVVFKSSN